METWKLDTPAHNFLIGEIKFKKEQLNLKEKQ